MQIDTTKQIEEAKGALHASLEYPLGKPPIYSA